MDIRIVYCSTVPQPSPQDNTAVKPFFHPLRIALVFMTTLPVRWPFDASDTDKRRSLYFYPLVGLVVGALLFVLHAILPEEGWLTAALLLVAWVVLTGALHIDGLVDSVDALVGGQGNRVRSLRILQDPAAGSMGVVAVVLLLILKLAAIQQLLAADNAGFLLAVPVIARTMPILLFVSTPYVRFGGLGATLRPIADERHLLLLSIAVALLLGMISIGTALPLCLAAAAPVFLLLRHLSRKRLGGFTGDVAGAAVELAEAAIIVTLALATIY